MPRISITLPPITITKGGAPSVPTPVAIEMVSNTDLGVDVLGVRYSDNSLKLLFVDLSDERAAINPSLSGIPFELNDGVPSFEYVSSTNYEEIGDLYEWIEVELNGSFDWTDDESNAIGYITMLIDNVMFACQYNIFDNDLSSIHIPFNNFVILTASLPQFVVLESGANKALGITKDGITCSLTDITGSGEPAVENNAIKYIADNGCEYVNFFTAEGSYDNYVKAKITSGFDVCNIDQGVRTARAYNTFFLLGIEYNAAFTVPNQNQFEINISDLTIFET